MCLHTAPRRQTQASSAHSSIQPASNQLPIGAVSLEHPANVSLLFPIENQIRMQREGEPISACDPISCTSYSLMREVKPLWLSGFEGKKGVGEGKRDAKQQTKLALNTKMTAEKEKNHIQKQVRVSSVHIIHNIA